MGHRKRLKLGILFNVDRNWLGGVYYIVNLVRALDALAESEKPDITVFYSESLSDFTREMKYSRLRLVPWKFEKPVTGYLKSWLTGRNVFSNEIVNRYDLDGIYPEWNQPVPVTRAYERPVRSVSWFADLQHKYYPEFFTRKQLMLREFRLRMMLRNTKDLVVSSESAKRDFKRFYRLREDLKIHVLKFVSIIEDFNLENDIQLRKKYGLPQHYFMVSNQFHKHKNHRLLLEALIELKRRGSLIHMAITGKMPEQPGSPYMKTLIDLIERHDLAEYINLLGVIPRQDQLSLMRSSVAVIQPSLFEGWSTVIEDAKSLQVPVIASNLEVNIEQLGTAGTYFDPHDKISLADILSDYKTNGNGHFYENYHTRVKDFANSFLNIFRPHVNNSGTTVEQGTSKANTVNRVKVLKQ